MPRDEATPPPAEAAFRGVMGRFATGVTVMTTRAGGVPHGMTANAVSSVSLEPRLVLVCVERDTEMAPLVAEAGVFALSILGADQDAVSNRFADSSRAEGEAQFADLAVEAAVTGAPVLADALAWLDCRVWATYDGGDHVIVVGEVLALAPDEDATDDGAAADASASPGPLIYYRSAYRTLAS